MPKIPAKKQRNPGNPNKEIQNEAVLPRCARFLQSLPLLTALWFWKKWEGGAARMFDEVRQTPGPSWPLSGLQASAYGDDLAPF